MGSRCNACGMDLKPVVVAPAVPPIRAVMGWGTDVEDPGSIKCLARHHTQNHIIDGDTATTWGASAEREETEGRDTP